MQPLLVTNIRFRRNKVGKLGLPKKYTASLFPDHIEVINKSKTDSENIAISEIAKAALANGVIVMRLNSGETRSLYFISVSQKVGTRGFGIGGFIGGAVSGLLMVNASKHKADAEDWLGQLRKLNVDTTVKV